MYANQVDDMSSYPEVIFFNLSKEILHNKQGLSTLSISFLDSKKYELMLIDLLLPPSFSPSTLPFFLLGLLSGLESHGFSFLENVVHYANLLDLCHVHIHVMMLKLPNLTILRLMKLEPRFLKHLQKCITVFWMLMKGPRTLTKN